MRSLVAILAFFLVSACWSNSSSGTVFEARTAAVRDGDSFIVKRGRNEFEVRLYGIDAPEKTQPWSDHARKGLRKLIDGQMLRIEMVERDRYQRIVARVYRVRDNLYINAKMIEAGHAWVYRRYTDDKQLTNGEKNARKSGVGLWQLPEHERIPPWEWRKENERS